MPTNRTKRSRTSNRLDYWKIDQLVTGAPLLAGVGYAAIAEHGCGHWTEEEWAAYHDAMRADWQEIGDEFMAWWLGETERFTSHYASIGGKRDPAVTPWAAEEFGRPWEGQD
jgi:hypothetical protein